MEEAKQILNNNNNANTLSNLALVISGQAF
jgi:hypothetical protein